MGPDWAAKGVITPSARTTWDYEAGDINVLESHERFSSASAPLLVTDASEE